MKKILALTISLAAALLLCMTMTSAVFAADALEAGGPVEIQAEESMASVEAALAEQQGKVDLKYANSLKEIISVVTPVSMNSSTKADPVYTPQTANYQTYSYTINMPKTGTFAVSYTGLNGDVYVSMEGASSIGSSSMTKQGYTFKVYYYYLTAGSYTLDVSVYKPSSGNNQGVFYAQYAPVVTATVGNTNKVYYHGAPGTNNKLTYFKVKAPAKGFFTLTVGDATNSGYGSAYIKTKGFKDFEYLSDTSTSIGNVRWIGAKKGTYTFSVKTYSPIYGVKSKFTKVKESKYGAKKKKAVKIKKKKTVKGVIITNAKKAHWYKLKNPKKQKVKLVFKTNLTGGGNYGGIKVTFYNKNSSFYKIISAGTGKATIQPYTIGSGEKLKKGTYWVKVESYKNGTGFFKMTWK